MNKPTITIGVAILACGLGFAFCRLLKPGRAEPVGPHVYDLTDGKFDRIGAPQILPFGGWIVEDPGRVRIDMPYNWG
jgi:hypothetical protein